MRQAMAWLMDRKLKSVQLLINALLPPCHCADHRSVSRRLSDGI